jgi:hypothetical protein
MPAANNKQAVQACITICLLAAGIITGVAILFSDDSSSSSTTTTTSSTTSTCWPGEKKSGTSCEKCSPGTYSSEKNAQACKSCEQGYFAPSSQMSSCQSCPAGMFSTPHVTGTRTCCKAIFQHTKIVLRREVLGHNRSYHLR